MGTLKDDELTRDEQHWSSDRLKLVMLQQMAEGLEDEANGLNRRAKALEEEEFLLSTEVQERLTEINRLNLRLEGLRSERDSLLERVEALRREAIHLKEEVLDNEEELALESLAVGGGGIAAPVTSMGDLRSSVLGGSSESHSPSFFRRTTITDLI
jgi:signal transduction histidine kinase